MSFKILSLLSLVVGSPWVFQVYILTAILIFLLRWAVMKVCDTQALGSGRWQRDVDRGGAGRFGCFVRVLEAYALTGFVCFLSRAWRSMLLRQFIEVEKDLTGREY
ncbi:hypothetical protein [Corallococcus sp. AB011P]|uniref:hypothetical protein n=1 Tax=Corallococcus sp. AB011P TaxID=2316735 RepID=UPI0011C43733|nr:hypothetical protein [Corallococcus sp. AB011P]